MERPDTRYAKTIDGLSIAYQVLGSGPFDLVYTPGWVSNVDSAWELPPFSRFMSELSAISRLIVFDRRGVGLSDRPAGSETLALELGMDDIRAVMDAADSTRAVHFGFEDGAMLTAMFAATYPERTMALIMFAPWATMGRSPDYPWGWTDEELDEWSRRVREQWGTREFAAWNLSMSAPALQRDPEAIDALARFFRAAASPGSIRAIEEMNLQVDARSVLPTVQVPALVMQRIDDAMAELGEARYAARSIPGAILEELAGNEHPPFFGRTEPIVSLVQRFVSSITEEEARFDRALATVLFTDIVGSTARASELGDNEWRAVVEEHHRIVRAMLARYRGTEVDTAGDGFFATFDGPARAVRCAQAIMGALQPLEIEIRAGVHTGEVENVDGKIGGMAVNIGARVGAMAGPSQVLASQTVKDLTAGSGLVFEDGGEHELKGVPDRWRLYRVVPGA
ncbi:MAG: adenylate/guanylate cyclase domain-containing protein [Actinomycetota bacterium]